MLDTIKKKLKRTQLHQLSQRTLKYKNAFGITYAALDHTRKTFTTSFKLLNQEFKYLRVPSGSRHCSAVFKPSTWEDSMPHGSAARGTLLQSQHPAKPCRRAAETRDDGPPTTRETRLVAVSNQQT